MADKPLAYSYIRFSTAEQAKGASLVRQIEKSRQYADQHGLLLDEALTFQDLGISAYRASNAGPGGKLGEFLDLVKAGRVPRGSYLLIESLDRLSRATISVAAQLLLGLLNEGIKVVTLIDDHVYQQTGTQDDFASLIISLTYLQRANDESRTKGIRVADAWRRKREGANRFKLTQLCPAWLVLSDDRSAYVQVPEHVAVVREILDLTLQGLGRGAIAKRFNAAGTPSIAPVAKRRKRADGTAVDHSWHPTYVHKVLINRALVGEFQPHRIQDGKRIPDGPAIADYFPRLIVDDEYDLIQSVIASRGQTSGGRRGVNFSNVFTGLLRCGYCGSSMVYVNKGAGSRGSDDPRKGKYLLCGLANRGAGCHRVPWPYYQFEDSFFELATKTNFADFISTTNDRTAQTRTLSDQIAVAEEQLDRANASVARLVDALAATSSHSHSIVERVVLLEEESAELTGRIEELRRARSAHEEQSSRRSEVIAALRTVKVELGTLDGDALFLYRASLNQHLRRVIEKITMYPGGTLSTIAQAEDAAVELLGSGYTPAVVAHTVGALFRTKPDPSQRTFVVRNRGTDLTPQYLSPDLAVPDLEDLLRRTSAARA